MVQDFGDFIVILLFYSFSRELHSKMLVSFNGHAKPDTQLPHSCAGGQGSYLRKLEHLSTTSEVKDCKEIK